MASFQGFISLFLEISSSDIKEFYFRGKYVPIEPLSRKVFTPHKMNRLKLFSDCGFTGFKS
tara:strand:- start:78474 stop:78656 length:183 start_codon:yes stop_codon:yes gene_type:complete